MTLEADHNIQSLLLGHLCSFHNAFHARNICCHGFLHKYMLSGIYSIFKMQAPETGRRCQNHHITGINNMLVTVKSGKPHLCRNIQSSRLSIPFVKIGIALLETIFKGISKVYNFYSLISLDGWMSGSVPTPTATATPHPHGIASSGIHTS